MGRLRVALALSVVMLPLLLPAAEQKPSIGEIISVAEVPHDARSVWAVSDAGLFHSKDAGTTWHSVPLRLPAVTHPKQVWAIAKPVAAIFVATNNRGLLRSVDEGSSWQFTNDGLPHGIGVEEVTPILSLVFSGEGASALVYLLTEAQGIFRSSNSGVSWESASFGLPVPLFNRTEGSLLTVHPQDPERVYVLLNVSVTSHHDRIILFASTNAGVSWLPLKEFGEDFHATAMEVDALGVLTLHDHDGHSIFIETPSYLDSNAPSMTYVSLLSAQVPGSTVAAAADTDTNNIAILEDDGSLITRQFDLSGKSFEFRPNIDNSYNLVPINAQLEPDAGERMDLGDDDSRSFPLPFSFPFYSQSWKTMFVNSNGGISFEKGDRSGVAQISSFLGGSPRIAPLWADLNPAAGGAVSVMAESSRVVVTWNAVPAFLQTTPNTYQLVLFADGRIRFNYGSVNLTAGITGISNGFQTDGNYVVFNNASSVTGLRFLPIVQVFRVPDIDPVRAALRFYQTHDDDFDELVYFAASSYPATVASGGAAYFARVKNEVRGVGVTLGDVSAQLGSSGRLRGVINMNSLAQYPDPVSEPIPDDPSSASAVTILGQEALHRFGAFIRFRDGRNASSSLLGRSLSHWNYFLNSEGSVMEGNEWVDNQDGSFTATKNFVTYSKLDAYLMGLRAASEVPPMMLITGPQPLLAGTVSTLVSSFDRTDNGIRDTSKDFGTPDRLKGLLLALPLSGSSLTAGVTIFKSGPTDTAADPNTISTTLNLRSSLGTVPGQNYSVTKFSSSAPQSRYYNANTGRFDGENIVVRGTRRDITMADILEIEGERVPAKGTAPTTFTQAFILIVPAGTAPAAADLAKVSAIRQAWEPFFRNATGGLGTMSTEVRPGMTRVTREIAAGGMMAVGTRGTDSSLAVGYGKLESGTQQATGVAFLSGRSAGRLVTETAIPAAGTLRRGRFFVERSRTVNTGLAISAPYAATSVSLQLRASSGAVIATATVNMEAGTQVTRFFDELLPASTIPADFKGSLILTATAPVTAVSIRTAINDAGEFLVSAITVADQDAASPASSYLTYFADGNGYSANIALMNPGSSPMRGVVEFRAPDGTLQPVRIGSTDVSSVRYDIPANGLEYISTAGSGITRNGYVAIRADAGQDGPIARGIINVQQDGRLAAMISMNTSLASKQARTVVDFSAGHDGGLALLNDSSRSVDVLLTLNSAHGAAIANSVRLTLAPQSQTLRYVSELFSGLNPGFRGTLEASADTAIQAMALHSTSSDDGTLLSTFPVEPVDIPRSDRVLFFPYLLDGSGYTSEIFISTIGTATSVPRLSFTSQTGDALRLLIR